MPVQAPRFRAPGSFERTPWCRAPGTTDKRKRGRAGQRERAQVVAEEPLCAECLRQGRESPTEVVDHIIPLGEGGSDTRTNKQGLCHPCHDAKSKGERLAAQRRRARH